MSSTISSIDISNLDVILVFQELRESGRRFCMAWIGKDSEVRGFLPLTPAVLHILLSLTEGEMHGYGIMREVERRTEGSMKLGPGTLYRSIKQSLERHLIEESEGRPDSEIDDQRRRYYKITDLGHRVAVAEVARLGSIVDSARQKGLIPEPTS